MIPISLILGMMTIEELGLRVLLTNVVEAVTSFTLSVTVEERWKNRSVNGVKGQLEELTTKFMLERAMRTYLM